MRRGLAFRVRIGDSVWRLRPPREWRRPRGKAMEVWGRDHDGTVEGYEYTELGPLQRLRRINEAPSPRAG